MTGINQLARVLLENRWTVVCADDFCKSCPHHEPMKPDLRISVHTFGVAWRLELDVSLELGTWSFPLMG